MAMTLAMDREPEVARFIDTYKFDQDMATKRDRFGGGTSLPLNSDGYEDKQRALRDERHKDWLVQQDKPKEPVYYRVGTPEQGFPGLGEYERQRQDKNIARQKEYNEMLKKQRHAEQQKQEARRYAPQARPAQPLGPQMDYNAAGELAKAEEKKAYQDYMGNWRTDQINAPHKPYMDYWENQRFLKEERRREYNELLEKKAKEERYWALRGRPVTPPGGLNIGQYDRQVKEQAPQKKQEYKRMLDEQKYTQLKLRAMDHAADLSSKYVRYREEERPLVGSPRDINPYMQEKESKDKFRRDLKNIPVQNHSPSSQNVNETSRDDPNYKAFMEVEKDKARDKRKYAEELLKQQKEHMFLRARQEPEMAVIDRNAQSSQFLANKPPPGPSYGRGRDESSRQTPAFWNEGKQAQGPTSLSSVASRSNQSSAYVPMTNSYSRPIPERPSHGQPPYPGRTIIQNDDQYNLAIPNRNYKPVSPEKPVDRELLKIPPKDTERPNEMGTPMAFKTDSLSQTLPEQSRNGQQFSQGEEMVGRPQSPANLPPMSPEKPINPEWLKRPVMDDELPPGVGTPLAFKTNSYANQPPPVPEQGYQRQPDYAPADDYMRQPQSPLQKRDFQGPPFSSDAHRSYRRREDGLDGTYGRPDQSERPRSRRSLDADRKQSPSKRDNAAKQNKVSPRRMKQQLYTDSEEVSLKRREASKERQKEYNDFLKLKDEKRKHESEVFQQQHGGKPAEIVKNPFYSSDDYEKFQKELKKKQEKEYSEFLSKQYQPNKDAQGLPLGQYKYEPMRLHLEAERNKEYNELLEKQNSPRVPKQVDGPQGLNIDVSYHREKQEWLEKQRNKDYNEYLKKKYGGNKTFRSSRSQPEKPTQPKSSFYYGNELEHEEKRKMLDDERRNDYHQFMKEVNNTDVKPGNYNPQIQEPPRSKSIDIPTDADSGLPIGQHHHEAWRKFLREQRNSEYNQLRETKQSEKRNRNWNFDETGVLELKGDDEVQLKKRELRAERREDYNQYISQIKAPTRRNWPEPEGQDGLLVRNGEYDNVRQMYDEERKRDYNDTMRKRREMGLDLTPPSAPAEPLQSRYEYFNPMINVLGRYEDYRKKLKDDRRKDFRHHMDQVKAEDTHRRTYVNTAPTIAREETPIVNSLGLYETETKNKMRAQRKKDMEEQVHEQEKHWTPRVTVKENLMPHVADSETPLVNYMGQYDKDRLKFRLERNKELRDFSEKKKHELRNPYDHFVYPTVAVAEKPIVEYMGGEVERRKHDLREERKKEYELFKKQVASNNQKVAHPGRRHEFVDSANGPYGGLFHGLGEHGNRSDDLNRERHREYNEKLEQQYAGRDRPGGRPKWVQESLPNNTDRGRSPMKTQPPTDQYQQMLNEKRREEANMRRYEDPEYQDRLAHGRDRGEAGQRYGY
ncbi:trichohyalin-like isoform X26 [Ruditapes philippinarum]|uniref:trichohyalin-like isoform X26 n=1 Tax=Ruditapes philippinarum TaxID=129788 RepID=UPI00295BE250|nr:trichohyalin-like isoform X26 [Ruditapes philippinarum]